MEVSEESSSGDEEHGSQDEEDDEEVYISNNKLLIFYPQIEFSLKTMELFRIFDVLEKDIYGVDRSKLSESGVHKAQLAGKVLGTTFFKIHVMILEARLDMLKKGEYPHDPLSMIYKRALKCMHVVKKRLDTSQVEEDLKNTHCRMSYVDYESFVMMFKYLDASIKRDINALEFTPEDQKDFLVNTVEMKILMNNHKRDEWTVADYCNDILIEKKNLKIAQQLCAELRIA